MWRSGTWTNDDGSSRLQDTDQHNQYSWHVYDTSGRFDEQWTLYDNGLWYFLDIEQDAQFSWSSYTNHYDNGSRLRFDAQSVLYDDASVYFYDVDQANQAGELLRQLL